MAMIVKVSPGVVEPRRAKGAWRLRVSVTRSDGTKARLDRQVSCRTKTEAKRLLDEWRMELLASKPEEGKADSSKELLLKDFLEDYLEFCEIDQELSPTTVRGYRDIVENRLATVARQPIGSITSFDVQKLCSWLRREGGVNGRPLSGSTVQKAYSFLKTALKHAVSLGIIPSNPCDFVRGPSRSKPKTAFLSEEEVLRMRFLLRGHPSPQFSMAANIALATGMRRGEICALRWCDVDFEGSRIKVEHSLCEARKKEGEAGRALVLKDAKTDSSNRSVAVDGATLEVLKAHKEAQFFRLAYNDVVQGATTPVCCGPLGEWYAPGCFTKDFEAFRSKHGFDIRLHDLRHTQASLLIDAGESFLTVSKRLGHARVSTTLDVYSHLLPGRDEGAAQKMGELFSRDAA